MHKRGGGFTLAELLIVVAVIAVLVAVAIPTFAGQLEKSRQAVDLSDLRQAYAAAKLEVLNQDDVGILKDEKASKTATVSCWYNVETETLAKAVDETPNKPTGKNNLGKATTGVAKVSENGLPKEIVYSASLRDTDGSVSAADVVGTTTKAILVTFTYSATDNAYSLTEVAYSFGTTSPTAPRPLTIKNGEEDADLVFATTKWTEGKKNEEFTAFDLGKNLEDTPVALTFTDVDGEAVTGTTTYTIDSTSIGKGLKVSEDGSKLEGKFTTPITADYPVTVTVKIVTEGDDPITYTGTYKITFKYKED